MPTLMMGDSPNDVAHGIDCRTIRQPIGVCAGVTPFNFPVMVPMWMYPFAIACGNAFILKPSEHVPLTPSLAIDLLHERGCRRRVELVHGDRMAVDALLHHPLFGRYRSWFHCGREVCLFERGHGRKRVQALGGAKNHLVVMPERICRRPWSDRQLAFGAVGITTK